MTNLRRQWKHPFHVDTFATLAEAQAILPLARFRRVLVGSLTRTGTVLHLEVVAPARHR